MNKKTVTEIDVAGKRVLVRVDFNVPLEEGQHFRIVADDTRIRAALPTIQYLLDQQAKVILMSHLGRPKGKVVEELRLDPVAHRLSELLHKPVNKLDDCVGDRVRETIDAMQPGEAVLLENTRFHPEEKINDPEFAAQLASLADVYVNDAFGTAHRAHASTTGVADHRPAVAGFLMEREIEFLSKALEAPDHPFLAILGGAKVSDKIGVIENLLAKVDVLLIGGGMANTFLKAQGHQVGRSLVEEDKLGVAEELLAKAGDKLVLPLDVVIAAEFAAEADSRTVSVLDVPAEWCIMDIGPQTVELFRHNLRGASTILWNGPLGVFEFPRFAKGTYAIAEALVEVKATTIIGGGDSAAAVRQAGVATQMTHVSTGGGASLAFLKGEILPGVAALDDRDV
ncbi:MAG: phosphoglycerate kinase [Anaerolineae bacterium]